MTTQTQNDSKLANDAGKAQRAAILKAMNAADAAAGRALVAGLEMTVKHGQTSADEVAQNFPRCSSPGVYASYFNRGAKAAAIIGERKALDAIAEGGKLTGAEFTNACDVLKAVIDGAKAEGVKECGAREATAMIKAAAVKVKGAIAAKRAAKADNATKDKRGTKSQDDATMREAAMQAGKGARETFHALQLLSNSARKLTAPEGRETEWKAGLAKLADACEAFAIFK
jgi:hypothetical protein